ncbi:MAG: molecular chaperone TorD family protein [Chloroflexi bacterium]|nr:molecular chaperone TorD family protein [Chloroflexota bacterium]
MSQALIYPDDDVVAAMVETDLPQAREATAFLPVDLDPELAAFGDQMADLSPSELKSLHGHIFSHVVSADCPPCEAFYTAKEIFQETTELADIAGFFKAFGLTLAESERVDHISVELEFMHFLTYKEAYAQTHHDPARARFCRETQRKFIRDHLGRWGIHFARLLDQRADGGYYGCLASLLEKFISSEVAFLRVNPEVALASQEWRSEDSDESSCPIGEICQ